MVLLDKTAHVTHKHHDAVSGIGPVHGIQFDADFYRKMYPDIRESGINPEEHFLQHGMAEGRLGYPPALEIDGNLSSFNEEFARRHLPRARTQLGEGVVVCAGVAVSNNVRLGRQVHINPERTTIGRCGAARFRVGEPICNDFR